MGENRNSDGTFAKGHTGNPSGRPRKDSQDGAIIKHRFDGWTSILTGIGTRLDKRQQTEFTVDQVEYGQAVDLMRGDDIAARIVEKLPRDAIRAGFEFQLQSDDEGLEQAKEAQETIEDRWKDLNVFDHIRRVAQYERGFGGGAIMMGTNGGRDDLRTPLDLDSVTSVDFLTPLEPRELTPAWYYDDPFAPKFGEVAIYRATPIPSGIGVDSNQSLRGRRDFEIHETRLIKFGGIRVTRRFWSFNRGWGDSVLTRVWRVLRDFNTVWDSAGVMTADFSQSVFKMKGLADLMLNDEDEKIKTRLQALEMGRSTVRAMVLDAEEDWERKSTSITGLPELLKGFGARMAAAADMPATELFGQTAIGLNANGEGDKRVWLDTVDGYRGEKIIPAVTQITKALVSEQRINSDSKWSVVGNPLWQPTAKEQAEERKIVAETDSIYIGDGVVMPIEITTSRFTGDGYSAETMVDLKEREKLQLELEAEQKTLLAEQPDEDESNPDEGEEQSGHDEDEEQSGHDEDESQ